MRLILASLNYRTASLAAREPLTLSAREAAAALGEVARLPQVAEVLVVSTCNRTEVLVRHRAEGAELAALPGLLFATLAQVKAVAPVPAEQVAVLHGAQVVEYLFRVAAGLESQILGEPQILGQLKEAYRLACRLGTSGFLVNKLMHQAFRVGKRARSETRIGAGAASVCRAAARLAAPAINTQADQVLLIGAGVTARLVAQHLVAAGCRRLAVTNRTDGKARALAAELGLASVPYAERAAAIGAATVIIAATAAPAPIVTAAELDATGRDQQRQRYVIDLGVPRNVAADVGGLAGVRLVNLDDLNESVDDTLRQRQGEIPRVEAIVREEVAKFMAWQRTLAVTPTIVALRERLEHLRQQELQRCAATLDAAARDQLDVLTRRLLNKLLHAPLVYLRQDRHGAADHSEFRVAQVRNVFSLDEEPRAD